MSFDVIYSDQMTINGTQILRSAEDVGMAVLLFSKYKAHDCLW